MKDTHLTLRVPAAVARVLDRLAVSRGVPKSQIVREAVARYVSPRNAEAVRIVSAAELAALWPSLPKITSDEAMTFTRDVAGARRELALPKDPWA